MINVSKLADGDLLGDITVGDEVIHMLRYRYGEGNLAICLETEDGEPDGVLTINLDDSVALERAGEFAVKTWGENECRRAPALASGVFEDTGKRIRAGYCQAEVWRFKE